MCGNGARIALMYFGPPTCPHGKTLIASAPDSHAVRISVGVSAPAMIGLPYRWAISMVESRRLGVTKNSAPASMQDRAVSLSSTVPAPSTIRSPNSSATFSSARSAPGTVIVISAARNRLNRFNCTLRAFGSHYRHDSDIENRGKNVSLMHSLDLTADEEGKNG